MGVWHGKPEAPDSIDIVKAATAVYRAEMDTFTDFLEAMDEMIGKDESKRAQWYEEYVEFAKKAGLPKLNTRQFHKAMVEHGYTETVWDPVRTAGRLRHEGHHQTENMQVRALLVTLVTSQTLFSLHIHKWCLYTANSFWQLVVRSLQPSIRKPAKNREVTSLGSLA